MSRRLPHSIPVASAEKSKLRRAVTRSPHGRAPFSRDLFVGWRTVPRHFPCQCERQRHPWGGVIFNPSNSGRGSRTQTRCHASLLSASGLSLANIHATVTSAPVGLPRGGANNAELPTQGRGPRSHRSHTTPLSLSREILTVCLALMDLKSTRKRKQAIGRKLIITTWPWKGEGDGQLPFVQSQD